ncbi:MAG: hypothetical protein HRT91_03250 [Piscirickettsiaceae bacterium]|nr:hypothetical protein [Piscirickettsiaceae bacterium]
MSGYNNHFLNDLSRQIEMKIRDSEVKVQVINIQQGPINYKI